MIQGMYANARSRVQVNGQYSEEFEVGVGVHQGSVLSPLLFILVLEALSREFRTGSHVPWELFYADDLVIIAYSLEECIERLEKWKDNMEAKGLHVNQGCPFKASEYSRSRPHTPELLEVSDLSVF